MVELDVSAPIRDPHHLDKVTDVETSKFLVLFVFGYRMQALGILGREVMLPRGLVGLGLATMDLSGAEIRQTLSLYTSASPLPSVVHCTHGKDRTGETSPNPATLNAMVRCSCQDRSYLCTRSDDPGHPH
jgi:hypothetical protein